MYRSAEWQTSRKLQINVHPRNLLNWSSRISELHIRYILLPNIFTQEAPKLILQDSRHRLIEAAIVRPIVSHTKPTRRWRCGARGRTFSFQNFFLSLSLRLFSTISDCNSLCIDTTSHVSTELFLQNRPSRPVQCKFISNPTLKAA